MKFALRGLVILGCAVLMTACNSAEKNHMGKEVEAVSSYDQKRPYWTFDSGWKMEDLRKDQGDDVKEPKFAYIVTSEAVKSDTAIPQCYAMAKTRASAEVGRQISETVKEAKAISGNSEESEFQSEIRTKAQNVITGYEEADKFYLKLKGDEDKPFRCFVLMKFPRKNLKALQGFVMKTLEKEAGGNADLKSNVQDATKKMMEEM